MKWRDRNLHNETIAGNIFPIEKVRVGSGTYGTIRALCFGNDEERLIIGNYCSIAGGVVFMLGGNHKYKRLSTYPFASKIFGEKPRVADTDGPIIVEDDVWIGYGAIILSGVTLGQGCVIAAGSIVPKDVPPYAIYIGGKVKKFRFPENIVARLKNFSFDMDDEKLELFRNYYKTEITPDNIDDILGQLMKDER